MQERPAEVRSGLSKGGWIGRRRRVGDFMKKRGGREGSGQQGQRFHGFRALGKRLRYEITCGARLAPSIHVQTASRATSEIVMQNVRRFLVGLAGGPEDVVDLGLADDALGPRHAELAGNPAGRRG